MSWPLGQRREKTRISPLVCSAITYNIYRLEICKNLVNLRATQSANLVPPESPLNPGKFLREPTNLGGTNARSHIEDLQHLERYNLTNQVVKDTLTLIKPSSSATQNLGPNTLRWRLLPTVNWKSENRRKSLLLEELLSSFSHLR